MIGGSTEVAARRAARLQCGFFPAVGDPRLAEIYQHECKPSVSTRGSARCRRDLGSCSSPTTPGDFFDLDALAEACGRERRYEFLFTSAPLGIPGGIGSPPNALAIT